MGVVDIFGPYVWVKFIYSEKATKFCEIFTFLLTGTTLDKSKVQISQNFVAFSEYMNFNLNLSFMAENTKTYSTL